MQIIKPLALVTLIVAGFANAEFLMHESDAISGGQLVTGLKSAKLESSIAASAYDCIACLQANHYYCDYSKSYNTGSCDTTSFYMCTTEFTGIS